MFRRMILGLFLVAVCTCFAFATDSAAKPNVLFIATDDLRVELGCYGGTVVKSPNIDRLAARGVLFSRAYCQQALCNPSRASLLSGLRPDAIGVTDLKVHIRDKRKDLVTLPQLFKLSGYHTQGIGKIFHNWHLTKYKDEKLSWSAPPVYHYNTHYNDVAMVDGEKAISESEVPKTFRCDVPDNAYWDGQVAELAVRALQERAEDDKRPFFLAVGFWKPHLPFNAPKRYWDLYSPDEIGLPPNLNSPKDMPAIAMHEGAELTSAFRGKITDEETLVLRHGYYAAVSYVDAQLGKILDELDRLGLADNTIIVFWSDHGFHLGEHDLWAKTSNFELDARVPLIISAPGFQKRAGVRCDSLVELLDLYPTLADLCGLTPPHRLDGVSLRQTLVAPNATVKLAAFTQHPRPPYRTFPRSSPRTHMGYSMRTEKYRYTEWRLVDSGEVDARELYDHDRDPRETVNLASVPDHSDIVSKLATVLRSTILPGSQQAVIAARPVVAEYADEVRRDKPVAFWRFADGDTSEVADAVGKHHATYRGSVKWTDGPPEIGGKAALFDGGGSYIEAPISTDLALSQLSVEFWIKSDQPWDKPFWPGSATLIGRATDGNGSGDWTIIGGTPRDARRPGCVVVGVGPKGKTDVLLSSPPKLNDGTWHHVVWTRSTSGENRLYVDGGLTASTNDGGGSIINNRPLHIGGDPSAKGHFLKGAMADVAIYPHVLPADRVKAHALAGGLTPREDRPFAAPIARTPLNSNEAPVAVSGVRTFPETLVGGPAILKPDALHKYVETFNSKDHTHFGQAISNEDTADWMAQNVPLFECPDREIEEIYHFRWWTFRKHIKETPDGIVITEFLPQVNWSGRHNTISCPAGHHFREGRWIRDGKYLDDYAVFWFRKGGSPRRYSFWAADAIYHHALATGDFTRAIDLLPDLITNFKAWEDSRLEPDGLFWQIDDRDGMEVSIGGSGHRGQGRRATINSYMYGDALAIAAIAEKADKPEIAKQYRLKAERIKELVLTKLWDADASFFKVLPRGEDAKLVDVRELHGFTPWYFHLPPQGEGYEIAWKQLMEPKGFYAPYGPTVAEQRHPNFTVSYQGHECQWNGPSWPFATSVTLTALANVLSDYPPQEHVSRNDYFETLKIYTKCHRLTNEDGTVVPWIDENLNPHTGDWIARTRLKSWKNDTWDPGKGGVERGKDYNHSSYCDLIITGLIGLRPRSENTVEVRPLLPQDTWDWFCLDGIPYHGRSLTILWDKTGKRYGRGTGLRILADGEEIGASMTLDRLTAPLHPEKQYATVTPDSTKTIEDIKTVGNDTGWIKHPSNPVLGGKDYGTIFDVSTLRVDGEYWMYVSWRPKKSIALSKSKDGINWSEPVIVLGPATTGWEDQVNRPGVVYRDGVFHMWYTGQAGRKSKIGYAASRDGVNFTRQDEPVLVAQLDWEKPSLMCPHVEWNDQMKLFRMWYSGGEDYEPDAIGYATSRDGIQWKKHAANPIFENDPKRKWEQDKVTACQIIRHGDWHLMFYIGFEHEKLARIGVARSRDGITGWERHPANPIISPTPSAWDGLSCYKPFAVYEKENDRWLLWYNGRNRGEMIGLAIHDGEDLGFPE